MLFIQNIAEKTNIGEDIVYVKTETHIYCYFYRDIYNIQESRMFRKPCQINV